MKHKDTTHGGNRRNSGRKKIYAHPTTIIFKCELKHKLAAKNRHGKELNRIFNEWLKSVAS